MTDLIGMPEEGSETQLPRGRISALRQVLWRNERALASLMESQQLPTVARYSHAGRQTQCC